MVTLFVYFHWLFLWVAQSKMCSLGAVFSLKIIFIVETWRWCPVLPLVPFPRLFHCEVRAPNHRRGWNRIAQISPNFVAIPCALCALFLILSKNVPIAVLAWGLLALRHLQDNVMRLVQEQTAFPKMNCTLGSMRSNLVHRDGHKLQRNTATNNPVLTLPEITMLQNYIHLPCYSTGNARVLGQFHVFGIYR